MSQVLLLLPSHFIIYSPFRSCLITEFTLFSLFLVTMSIFNPFLHRYIFCISLFFLHDEVYVVFLLASSRNLHLLSLSAHHIVYIQPRPKPSSMNFFLPSFLPFLPPFLSFYEITETTFTFTECQVRLIKKKVLQKYGSKISSPTWRYAGKISRKEVYKIMTTVCKYSMFSLRF